ncbi:response regulator [Nisaea sp.]|uniref:response regulator transcription factor n=1 Tax=Nisaea sp. TaxID=2024842 RepID=UPI0032ECEF11
MKKLLIVDDDLDLVDLVTRAFIQSGYDALGAANASDAIDATEVGLFDGAILDMRMPDGHGVDLCKQLRVNILPSVPVLFMTSRDDLDAALAGFSAGGDDHVIKPIKLGELVKRMERLLEITATENLATRRAGLISSVVERAGIAAHDFDDVAHPGSVRQ